MALRKSLGCYRSGDSASPPPSQASVALLSGLLFEGEVGTDLQGNVSTHVVLTNSEGPKQHSGPVGVSYGAGDLRAHNSLVLPHGTHLAGPLCSGHRVT